MNLVTVVGARPQFVKAAIVSRALNRRRVDEAIVHTGQHFDTNMSQVFFDELEMPAPARHLGIGGGTHGQNTGRMIERIESVLVEFSPRAVLVYGDTDSTLAAAVAAAKLNIPIAHVEAGLRSFNRRMPEEINRVLTDHASSLLFAPTQIAVRNLAAEGIAGDRVIQVGDVMHDAALFYGAKADRTSNILDRLSLGARDYALATVHRAENTDEPARLSVILNGFAKYGGKVVLPMHPRAKARIEGYGLRVPANVLVIEPVGYLDMVMLEKHACLIATDSGGVQKEAFFHRVPCATLRDETEWVELVDSGWNRLVPPVDADAVARAMAAAVGTIGAAIAPYGPGDSSDRIAARLAEDGAERLENDPQVAR